MAHRHIVILNKKTHRTRPAEYDISDATNFDVLTQHEVFDWQASYRNLERDYLILREAYRRIPSWLLRVSQIVGGRK